MKDVIDWLDEHEQKSDQLRVKTATLVEGYTSEAPWAEFHIVSQHELQYSCEGPQARAKQWNTVESIQPMCEPFRCLGGSVAEVLVLSAPDPP